MRTICTVVWRDRHWVEWIGSVFCRTLLYLPNLLATLQIEIKELRSQVLNGYACKQGRITFKQNDDDMQAGCTAFRHMRARLILHPLLVNSCSSARGHFWPQFCQVGTSRHRTFLKEKLDFWTLEGAWVGVLHAEHSFYLNDFQKARWPKAI